VLTPILTLLSTSEAEELDIPARNQETKAQRKECGMLVSVDSRRKSKISFQLLRLRRHPAAMIQHRIMPRSLLLATFHDFV
jgi:hypothetical protein